MCHILEVNHLVEQNNLTSKQLVIETEKQLNLIYQLGIIR